MHVYIYHYLNRVCSYPLLLFVFPSCLSASLLFYMSPPLFVSLTSSICLVFCLSVSFFCLSVFFSVCLSPSSACLSPPFLLTCSPLLHVCPLLFCMTVSFFCLSIPNFYLFIPSSFLSTPCHCLSVCLSFMYCARFLLSFSSPFWQFFLGN